VDVIKKGKYASEADANIYFESSVGLAYLSAHVHTSCVYASFVVILYAILLRAIRGPVSHLAKSASSPAKFQDVLSAVSKCENMLRNLRYIVYILCRTYKVILDTLLYCP